ncbi:MAG: serine/threonine-protein kinase [Paracoccus sp. (in: a-proteobacteria)]|nr:serine/threonine-protein kinase [Paracoccus sp. (in: a-proteobacteria)]
MTQPPNEGAGGTAGTAPDDPPREGEGMPEQPAPHSTPPGMADEGAAGASGGGSAPGPEAAGSPWDMAGAASGKAAADSPPSGAATDVTTDKDALTRQTGATWIGSAVSDDDAEAFPDPGLAPADKDDAARRIGTMWVDAPAAAGAGDADTPADPGAVLADDVARPSGTTWNGAPSVAADGRVDVPVADAGRAVASDATRIGAPAGPLAGAAPFDATRLSPPPGQPVGDAPQPSDPTRISAPPAAAAATAATGAAAAIAASARPVLPARERTQAGVPAPGDARHIQPVEPGVLINNNYRIQRVVSAGGMGEVYRGENVFTGDPVAIKIVLPDLARDPEIIGLFKREARILGQLSDDAIVRYHNFVLDTALNRYCLVMEFIDGTHLWDHVDAGGPLAEAEALALMRRVAVGLGKAHARGVTHRDLSPDNVILRGGRIDDAVLIDFGIARSDELGEGGLEGRFAGKLKYIAPEQLGHWGGRVGPRTDIYGMALMMVALLRGRALEMGNSTVEAAQARRSIPDLGGLGPRAMPLLQYMLEPDPEARPTDMAAVVAMLDDPTRVPARYRLPLWKEGAVGSSTGLHTAPPLGRASYAGGGRVAVEDASDSPFSAAAMVEARDEVAPVKTGRGGVIAVTLLALAAFAGAGGWLTRDVWMGGGDAAPGPVTASPADPVPADPLAGLPARDGATRAGFLGDYALPDCVLARRIEAGAEAGRIGVFAQALPFAGEGALLDAYAEQFGARPAVVSQPVTAAQCPVLDFTGALSGRDEAPPAMVIDSTELRSGGAVIGRVSGTAGRSLWLFLVSSRGAVYDLSPRLRAEADGSFTFEVGMALPEGDTEPAPQLLVAVASRGPLIAAAAAADGADAGALLPRVLAEMAGAGGAAAVDIAGFTLLPAGAPVVAPEGPQTAGDETAPEGDGEGMSTGDGEREGEGEGVGAAP